MTITAIHVGHVCHCLIPSGRPSEPNYLPAPALMGVINPDTVAADLEALDLASRHSNAAATPFCTPPFYPSKKEHEDVRKHSMLSKTKFYVVKQGLNPGIYTEW